MTYIFTEDELRTIFEAGREAQAAGGGGLPSGRGCDRDRFEMRPLLGPMRASKDGWGDHERRQRLDLA